MVIERKKIDKWNAIVYFDDTEKEYAIAYNGQGGAIIAHKNRIEAEKRWTEAMVLAESIDKLLYFKEHGHFINTTQ